MPGLRGQRVVLVVSGGNIDLTILDRLIEAALVVDGRRLRFSTTISDRPGSLAHLASLLAEAEVSVQDIFHDRCFSGPDVARVRVVCTVETRDGAHQLAVLEHLTRAGLEVVRQA